MNCPNCHAYNADNASFCSLCMARFDGPPPPGPAEPIAAPASLGEEPAAGSEGEVAQTENAPSQTALRGNVRRTEEGFDWRCPRCAEWTPIEMTTCRVCQLPFRAAVNAETKPPPPAVDPVMATALTLVLPGAGHIARGRAGIGFSRLVLFLLFFFGGLSMLSSGTGSTASRLSIVPLFLGAGAVWFTTAIDIRTLAGGSDRTLVQPRGYLWLTVAVLVMTMLAALPALFSTNRDRVPAPSETQAPEDGSGDPDPQQPQDAPSVGAPPNLPPPVDGGDEVTEA